MLIKGLLCVLIKDEWYYSHCLDQKIKIREVKHFT